ncbi:MAG: zinc ribbon domain-containing protein [Thermoleophilia bacterium]|nr:zinc ribbon domain-containing protein [Thermoleophilia bacterium]MDH4340007.1 zinc ribbon domain-containing protein [Thermoleophilia bacterium]
MAACPSCGHDNLDGAKFCMECAVRLSASARPAAEERKVVSVLFCDSAAATPDRGEPDLRACARGDSDALAMANGTPGALRLIATLLAWMGRHQEQTVWTSLKRLLEQPQATTPAI